MSLFHYEKYEEEIAYSILNDILRTAFQMLRISAVRVLE